MLWTSCKIIVGGTLFETHIDTVTPPGNATLAQLFAESGPGSVYDDEKGVFMFPERLCHDPAVFDLLLDFLRVGQWLPIGNRRLHADVCRVAATLAVRTLPPLATEYASQGFKREYVEVTLPYRPSLREKLKQRRKLLEQIESGRGMGAGGPSDGEADGGFSDGEGRSGVQVLTLDGQAPHGDANETGGGAAHLDPMLAVGHSCAALADLAERGYCVVAERPGTKLRTGDNGALLSMPSTIVGLERKQISQLPLISLLATTSSWFLTLTQCI